jgi:RNA-directed DNA polymerase
VVEQHGGFAASLTGTPQGGIISPLLANIYLSILDRHFDRIWKQLSPPWRRQQARRRGQPTYRLIRYADDFIVAVHGSRQDAESLRAEIGELLATKLNMTLSAEKTLVTHVDSGFDFLGFHVRRKAHWRGRTGIVTTYPSKAALASVTRRIKQTTRRGTTSLQLGDVLRVVNRTLRGWAAYFKYSASKTTFAYLGYYAWWRVITWLRRKHPKMTWKQIRRRFYGANRLRESNMVLYNPAKMRVQRYSFRGAQICTPYNVDEVDPAGARFRATTHDDVAFVGHVSELVGASS